LHYKRLSLLTVAAVTSLLAMPNLASAEIRQGTLADPVGDSLGAPSQDIISAKAEYDTNGQMTVTATVNGDIASGPRSFLSFGVRSYAAPDQCTGTTVSIFGFSDSQYNSVLVSGVSGTGDGFVTKSGSSISFRASGNALKDRDYSCMTLSLSRGGQGETGIVDQLNVPLFFDGYGPDSDGDGVKDNVDKCPAEVGPTPTGCSPDSDGDGVKDNVDQCVAVVGQAATGCPAAVITPPATTAPTVTTPSSPTTKTCKAPKLKGKSLSTAKAAISKAGCKLGKVSKPKKVRKGAVLVVVRQSGTKTIALTLAPKTKKR
jgi:hypothetical protein